jgi:hypothetical protein
MGEFFNRTRRRRCMATETLQLLNDNNIKVMNWPPKAIDLSPIEKCFGEMQRRAKAEISEIENKDELYDFLSDLVFEDHFT